MNCPNCGAPLNNPYKCEYCGSIFNTAKLLDSANNVIFIFGDEKVHCYLSRIDAVDCSFHASGRDIYGHIKKDKIVTKRKFTLMEF